MKKTKGFVRPRFRRVVSANQRGIFRWWVIIWANPVKPLTAPQIFITHSSSLLVFILIAILYRQPPRVLTNTNSVDKYPECWQIFKSVETFSGFWNRKFHFFCLIIFALRIGTISASNLTRKTLSTHCDFLPFLYGSLLKNFLKKHSWWLTVQCYDLCCICKCSKTFHMVGHNNLLYIISTGAALGVNGLTRRVI